MNSREIDDLLAEMHKIRQRLLQDGTQLLSLSRKLSDIVRRDNNLTLYLPFANAWIRFSGMLLLGLRRTSAFDRYARAAIAERPKLKEVRKQTPITYLPSRDDLAEVEYYKAGGPARG